MVLNTRRHTYPRSALGGFFSQNVFRARFQLPGRQRLVGIRVRGTDPGLDTAVDLLCKGLYAYRPAGSRWIYRESARVRSVRIARRFGGLPADQWQWKECECDQTSNGSIQLIPLALVTSVSMCLSVITNKFSLARLLTRVNGKRNTYCRGSKPR